MENELCNLLEMARLLNIPASWLKNEALAGRIPCLKIGRRLLFNPAAARSALAQQAKRFGVREGGNGH